MVKSTIVLSLLSLLGSINAAPLAVEKRAAGKRGVAFNDANLTKLFPKGQVTWMYNWVSAAPNTASKSLEFVPMLHSTDAQWTNVWNAEFEASYKNGARHVLSFNEPDQCGSGGVCINDPAVAAAGHKKWIQPIATKHTDVLIGSVAVTNGGAPKGITYLQNFLKACNGCKIDFVVAHWYDAATNVAYFKQHLQDVYKAGGNRPVWLTEFRATGDEVAFLNQVLPWLDAQPWIARYAYFWGAPGVLVNSAGTGLSTIGQKYIA